MPFGRTKKDFYFCDRYGIISDKYVFTEDIIMKHIKSLNTRDLRKSAKKGGCGECQTSCQSACKTSCTVGNQSCEQLKK
jgi:predicted ribosomally synthesized six-cysteine peptide SCIFF